ncbi:MAG: hypothetical protein ACE5F1_02300 [Planctomycetota bacterium]
MMPRSPAPHALSVELRLAPGEPVLATESVTAADLVDARSEAWWNGCLRMGHPEVPLFELPMTLSPVYREEPICAGFTLELTNPEGRPFQCSFGRSCLDFVAWRGARKLLSRGVLQAEDTVSYELRADASAGLEEERGPGMVLSASRPLEFLSLPLAAVLDEARNSGHEAGDGRSHLFYTDAALEKAERISRAGADSTPPVETGGVLVGLLCRCPASGQMYTLVTDVIEASDADEQTFSLSYSSRTWARIQAVLNARRKETPELRILGQAHGHSFLPLGGAAPCEVCDQVEVCGRTTAFLSADDLTWCRAVFSAQPWQVSVVYGLNARGEAVDAHFGLHGGRLERRGYHVIPELDEIIKRHASPAGRAR